MAYISVGLTTEARDALRSAVTELTSPVGRRLTMSELVLGSLAVARRHESELVAALADDEAGARA